MAEIKKKKKNILKEGALVRLKIDKQGAPLLNNAVLYKKSKDIACVHIDCKSKYLEVDCYTTGEKGECGILVSASEGSFNLKEGVPSQEMTSLSFPDFIGWRVFATSSGRYTISVCLVK